LLKLRIKLGNNEFLGKYIHAKVASCKGRKREIKSRVHAQLYLKDDECKIIKNKTLVIKEIMFLAATLVGWTGGGHCLSMERWQVAFNIEQFFISVRIIEK